MTNCWQVICWAWYIGPEHRRDPNAFPPMIEMLQLPKSLTVVRVMIQTVSQDTVQCTLLLMAFASCLRILVLAMTAKDHKQHLQRTVLEHQHWDKVT
ncbi:hypothetical protein TNCV_4331621 [Trichonephila clavipes]|nr:hypothetical protein TNCV_4331621 [Trichonephila clavipes]